MKIHPAAMVLPPLSDREYARLKSDIAKNGLLSAIMVIEVDGEPQVIDGRHRLRACEELDIAPEYQYYDLENMTPGQMVWSTNGLRRHLKPSQRAAFYAELCGKAAKLKAKERQVAGLMQGDLPVRANLPERETDDSVRANLPGQKEEQRARDEVAEIAGVSPRTVQDAMTVQEADPELFEQVKEGAITASAAARQVRGQSEKPRAEPSSQVGKIVELFRMMGDCRIRALKEVIKTLEQHERHVLLDWLETMIDHVE